VTTATSAAHFEISIFNSSIPKRPEYVKRDLKETIYCVIIQKEARQQEDLPGRSEAIRRLVELGLKAKSKG